MFEQRETLWYQWHQCVNTAQNVNLRRKGLCGFYFAFFLEVVKNKTSDDAFSEGVLFVHQHPVTGLHRGVQPMACRLELAHGTILSCLVAFPPPTSLGPRVRGKPLISNAQAELPNSSPKPLWSEPKRQRCAPLGGGCHDIPELYFHIGLWKS